MRTKIYFLIISLLICNFSLLIAQDTKVSIYDPTMDAKAEINAAVAKASAEKKQVLIQVGGNWCSWCVKMHKLLHTNATIDSLVKSDYVFIMVNYSKENKNLEVLKELGNPQRFGFPVLVILDRKGNRLHTQDTGLLESGDGYDPKKIIGVLQNWNVSAVEAVITK